jgi:hypothetical protein
MRFYVSLPRHILFNQKKAPHQGAFFVQGPGLAGLEQSLGLQEDEFVVVRPVGIAR